MRTVSIAAALAAAALAAAEDAPRPAAPPQPVGTVTFLDGQASRLREGGAEPLAVGRVVHVGDTVETAGHTRLELELLDRSHLRLGPLSRLVVRAGRFGPEPGDRNVAAALLVGSLWSTVTHAVGAGSSFEVQAANAVAGVRGTTFRVDAATDQSVVVKVYAGSVAVTSGLMVRRHGADSAEEEPGTPTPPPTPTPTPTPSPTPTPPPTPTPTPTPSPTPTPPAAGARWEELVTAMQELRIPARGRPERPAPVLLRAEPDPFERWNRDRDERLRKKREALEHAGPRREKLPRPARERTR